MITAGSLRRDLAGVACALSLLGALISGPAHAQDAWSTGVEILKSVAPQKSPSNTTTIGRQPSGDDGQAGVAEVRLVALLTANGQQIDQGLIWRVFEPEVGGRKAKLIGEYRAATPELKLKPGDYTVNAAFGRAHFTRRITVKPATQTTEEFVLNAGGLRVRADYNGARAGRNLATYSIYSDDREQPNSASLVMSSVKPGLIIRLNAGIYRIVSRFGDANAKVEADVTVEAGKLSETTITHVAGRAAFKLVTRPGGEALPGTTWTIKHTDGTVVKETVGALPSHYLNPGKYIVAAKSAGQVYSKAFEVKDGAMTNVELVRRDSDAGDPSAGAELPAESVSDADTETSNDPLSFPGFSLDNSRLMPGLGFRSQ